MQCCQRPADQSYSVMVKVLSSAKRVFAQFPASSNDITYCTWRIPQILWNYITEQFALP